MLHVDVRNITELPEKLIDVIDSAESLIQMLRRALLPAVNMANLDAECFL